MTPIAPPPRAAPDEMLTMRPHFFARIEGSTAWVQRKTDLQVHRDGRIEVAFGEVVDAAHDRDARIVDEDVDRASADVARSTIALTADMLDHFGDAACDTSAATAMARPPSLLMPRHDGVCVSGTFAIVDRDGGAGFGERHGDRGADAAGCRPSPAQCGRSESGMPGHDRTPFKLAVNQPPSSAASRSAVRDIVHGIGVEERIERVDRPVTVAS